MLEFPLLTERLLLRPYVADDLDAAAAMHAREDVAAYLPWDALDREKTAARLEKFAHPSIEKEGDVAIVPALERDGGAYVGEFMLRVHSDLHRHGEVGYIIDPSMAGRGYATEGALEMLRLGFDVRGLHRITGHIDPRNAASAHVLEKCGMRKEGHFLRSFFAHDEWTDEGVYALLEEEWSARISSPT